LSPVVSLAGLARLAREPVESALTVALYAGTKDKTINIHYLDCPTAQPPNRPTGKPVNRLTGSTGQPANRLNGLNLEPLNL